MTKNRLKSSRRAAHSSALPSSPLSLLVIKFLLNGVSLKRGVDTTSNFTPALMKSGRRAVYSSAPCFLLRSGSHHLYSSFPNGVSLKNGVDTNSNFTPTNLKLSSANISIVDFRSLYLSPLTMCPEGYWSHQMSHLSPGTRACLFTASSQSGEKILSGQPHTP